MLLLGRNRLENRKNEQYLSPHYAWLIIGVEWCSSKYQLRCLRLLLRESAQTLKSLISGSPFGFANFLYLQIITSQIFVVIIVIKVENEMVPDVMGTLFTWPSRPTLNLEHCTNLINGRSHSLIYFTSQSYA